MERFTEVEPQLLKRIVDNRLCIGVAVIREAVEKIWATDAPRIIQDFTDHGISHSERLAVFALKLLGANNGCNLSPQETYLLLASIYLHDIGMQCDVLKFPEIRAHAEKLGAKFGIEFTTQTSSGYGIDEQKVIRKNHQYLTAAWIDHAYRTGETALGTAARTIPEYLVADLMDVCKYHARLPIMNCPPTFKFELTGRKQLVAALLRFSDELDMEGHRVSIETVKNFRLDPHNSVYWWLHSRTHAAFTARNVITLTIRLHPDDMRQCGELVRAAFITEFQTKNHPVLTVLAKNEIPVHISSDSDVVEDDHAEPLSYEIVQALQQMGHPSDPEFANREKELARICDSERESIVVDAPAGYGKTYLLQEAANRYKRGDYPEWKCILIDLGGQQISQQDILNEMYKSFGNVPADRVNLDQLTTAIEDQKKNVLLLFDTADAAPRGMVEWLRDKIVPYLRQRTELQIRVVFAGRYISKDKPHGWHWSQSEYGVPLNLGIFDERIVSDLVCRTAQKSPAGKRVPLPELEEIAKEITFVSGGHPRSIKAIIRDFDTAQWRKDIPGWPEQFFDGYVAPRIEESFGNFRIDEDARKILEVLSVFRRFNVNTIQALQTVGEMPAGDPMKLLNRLTRTNLVSFPTIENPFYSDAIIRNLLLVQMRLKKRGRYDKLNRLACEIYDVWIAKVEENPPPSPIPNATLAIFMVEGFYHFLQCMPEKQFCRVQGKLQEYYSKISGDVEGTDRSELRHMLKNALMNDQEIYARLQDLGFGDDEINTLWGEIK